MYTKYIYTGIFLFFPTNVFRKLLVVWLFIYLKYILIELFCILI